MFQPKNECTNPSLDQVHMLKGIQSYKQHFISNSKGHREPLSPCFGCARTGHSPALCKFNNVKCPHCGKLGASDLHARVERKHTITLKKILGMLSMYRKNKLRVIESIASGLSLLMVRSYPIQLCRKWHSFPWLKPETAVAW